MFANTQAGGMDQGFPDVCLTPAPPAPAPVPIPYPNIAQGPMGVPAVYHILFGCAPTHNMGTSVPLTNGDNAGVAMGVASGTEMAKTTPVTAAFTCLIGGKPVTRMTMSSIGNSTNCPTNTRLSPSQTKILILMP
jgi:hypothetical protein